MASVGGSVDSVTLSGRFFSVASDADIARKLGGYENEVMPNGDGSGRQIMTAVSAGLSGLVLAVDDDNGDHEFLQELANSKGGFPYTITYVSGVTYQGKGVITGELQYNNQTATASLNIQGTEPMTKQ